MEHTITTNSGLTFSYDAPVAAMVDIGDVAVALGNTCRFAGHVRHYYSVAEHSMLVCTLLRGDIHDDPDLALAALWHDGHEAYLGDCPTPLKEKIKAEAPSVWEDMETAINAAIADKLDLDVRLFDHPAIRNADREALAYEASVLKVPGTPIYNLDLRRYKTEAEGRRLIAGLRPEDAAVDFLAYHATMQRRRA